MRLDPDLHGANKCLETEFILGIMRKSRAVFLWNEGSSLVLASASLHLICIAHMQYIFAGSPEHGNTSWKYEKLQDLNGFHAIIV